MVETAILMGEKGDGETVVDPFDGGGRGRSSNSSRISWRRRDIGMKWEIGLVQEEQAYGEF